MDGVSNFTSALFSCCSSSPSLFARVRETCGKSRLGYVRDAWEAHDKRDEQKSKRSESHEPAESPLSRTSGLSRSAIHERRSRQQRITLRRFEFLVPCSLFLVSGCRSFRQRETWNSQPETPGNERRTMRYERRSRRTPPLYVLHSSRKVTTQVNRLKVEGC